jgi:hypothetical protein
LCSLCSFAAIRPCAPRFAVRHPWNSRNALFASTRQMFPMRLPDGSYAFLCISMRFLCTFYALSMHFLCTFYAIPI